MKKVFLFLILCCTLMVVSCSKLNNGGKSMAELLIGKWQAIKTETYDGKGNLIETYYPDDGILNITDSIIYSNVDGEVEAFNYTFDEDHQWIVLSVSWIWTVTKLTKDELVIKYPDFDEDYEDGWYITYFKKVK